MGEVVYRSKVSIEREMGPLRWARLPAEPDPIAFGVHSEVAEHYRQVLDSGMPHHLGHGVGLQPHEYPHLNPKWDDVLMGNRESRIRIRITIRIRRSVS